MKTNDLKKGAEVVLRGTGWKAIIADNARGNTRIATVYGFETETGSVYSHDIEYFVDVDGGLVRIEHTDAQKKLRKQVEELARGL